jgi:hypothetical protein
VRRPLIAIEALVCVLTVSAMALAASQPLARGSVRGKVVYLGQWSVTIQTPAGQTVTLATTLVPDLIDGLLVGDTISVTYAKDPSGLLVPHALTTPSTPAPPTTTPTPTLPPPGLEPMAAG